MLQTSSFDSYADFPLIMGQALADREDLHMALIDRSGRLLWANQVLDLLRKSNKVVQ
jgi:hypothetical protein